MSHDFARSHRLKKESARKPARKKSGGVSSWLWVLVGTLVGCLVMFLVYLSGMAPQLPNLKAAQQPAAAQSEQKPSAPTAPPKRVSPVFEFYTKLPEGGQPVTDIQQPAPEMPAASNPAATEVTPTPAALDPIQQLLAEKEAAKVEPKSVVDPKSVAVAAEPAKPLPSKTETAKAPASRYLQAGVFRSKAEVDKLKARIALLGMKPTVQTLTNTKGETLQKVLVGPFSSTADMEDAKIILGGNGVNTIPTR